MRLIHRHLWIRRASIAPNTMARRNPPIIGGVRAPLLTWRAVPSVQGGANPPCEDLRLLRRCAPVRRWRLPAQGACGQNRFDPVAHPELPEDGRDVVLHGRLRKIELA